MLPEEMNVRVDGPGFVSARIAVLLGAALISLCMLLLDACAPGQYRPKANEELYGTWINEEYGAFAYGNVSPQKIILDYVGYWYYTRLRDQCLALMGQEVIDSKWSDSEGNILYNTFGSVLSYKFQKLYRLSKSATVLECVTLWLEDFNPDFYPSTIDRTSHEYRIYFRAPDRREGASSPMTTPRGRQESPTAE